MKKLLTILLSSLLLFTISLPVHAATSIEIIRFTENNTDYSDNAIIPKALITTANVKKESESRIFEIAADIVTNDGTQKIIDIKNIRLISFTGDIKEINMSSGEIWESGSYATVTITYRNEKNSICTDIVKFYPYGR